MKRWIHADTYTTISNVSRYSEYLLSHYKFVTSVDPEITDKFDYMSNFFVTIHTSLSSIFPEEAVATYNLEDVVKGAVTQYGIGGPEEVEISPTDLAKDVANMFYTDAEKFGLVPVMQKNSYSIMRYSNTSYFYRWERDSDYNMILRLEFDSDSDS